MRTVIDSVCVNYEIQGEGSPVLLLHGWGGSIESFSPVANYLLKQGKKVISIDFPGHGKSGEPPEPWSVREYTAMTAKFIEQLGIMPCDIIAHSFGGRVAILLASTMPQLVKKLVLVDSAGLRQKRTLRYYYKIYVYKICKKLVKSPLLNRVLRLDERQKGAGSSDYRVLSGVMRGTFVKVVNQDLQSYLSAIKAPTLLIWGSEDKDTPLWMGKKMEAEISDAGLVIFQNAGHFSYLDGFGRFCKILTSFLGSGV